MPVYEYKCSACGKNFELLRRINDSDSEIKCPKCGAANPCRVFSVFAGGSSGTDCTPSSLG